MELKLAAAQRFISCRFDLRKLKILRCNKNTLKTGAK